MGRHKSRCLEFFFAYPQAMLGKDGKLHRVFAVEMKAELVRGGSDHEVVIQRLYAMDLDNPGGWFELCPHSEGYRLPCQWIMANHEQAAQLLEKARELCEGQHV